MKSIRAQTSKMMKKMTQEQKRYFSFFLLILSLSLAWPGQHGESASTEEFQSMELASRETVLKPVKTEVPKKQDQEVIKADPLLPAKWGIAATDSTKAWERLNAVGSPDVVIAIIDTGIDVDHPDVRKALWVNPGETGRDAIGRDKASNGIDDDNNGYTDDVHGWNFVDNNNSLTDNHGHGTHIAGIVGAERGNGVGISGVASGSKLMILKYYDPKSKSMNNLMNTVKAIDYAVRMHAKIINYSGGGLEKSQLEFESIARAQRQGILFVAAAGNERSNSDVKGYYPADYDLDNIISVTAIDKEKNVLPTSNYGVSTVDVAAPGNDILSTVPRGKYGTMTGTSQATAYVTGVAALIMSKFKDFDAKKVIKLISETGDLEPSLTGKTRYSKRLNTYRALAILDTDVSVNGAVVQNQLGLSPKSFSNSPESNRSVAQDEPSVRAANVNNSQDFSNLGEALKKLTEPVSQQQPVIQPAQTNLEPAGF